MFRGSLSRPHTPAHLHSDDGDSSSQNGSSSSRNKGCQREGSVRFEDTDYTREEICISHNCRPRLSVCVHGLISRSARFRPSNVSPSIECKGRSVSPSLTDKTTVFVPNNGCGPFIDPPIIGTPPNAGTNFSRIRTCHQRFRKIRNISRIFRKQFLHSLFHREKWQATTKLIILRKLEFDRERDNGRIGLLSNLCSIFRCWKTAKRFIDKGQWLNKAGDV